MEIPGTDEEGILADLANFINVEPQV